MTINDQLEELEYAESEKELAFAQVKHLKEYLSGIINSTHDTGKMLNTMEDAKDYLNSLNTYGV